MKKRDNNFILQLPSASPFQSHYPTRLFLKSRSPSRMSSNIISDPQSFPTVMSTSNTPPGTIQSTSNSSSPQNSHFPSCPVTHSNPFLQPKYESTSVTHSPIRDSFEVGEPDEKSLLDHSSPDFETQSKFLWKRKVRREKEKVCAPVCRHLRVC